MMIQYLKYYDLEKYILTEVRNNFNKDGYLNAFDFFCIVVWKANRAKSKIANRLLKFDTDLNQIIKKLTHEIFLATEDKQKLKILIDLYGFRLPMASAILSMLYPDSFTIYDIRVCDTLTEYKKLNNITNFENLWPNYKDYIQSVKNYEPEKNICLRDKDRSLWGKSFYEQLEKDLINNFEK